MHYLLYAVMGWGMVLWLGGCVNTTVGMGSTAVPGKYVYLTGELQATYSLPLEQMWPTTLSAMNHLRLTLDGQYRDSTEGELEGRRADGTPFKVRLKPVGQHSTTIGIRVGFPGNREQAEFFHRAIQLQLNR